MPASGLPTTVYGQLPLWLFELTDLECLLSLSFLKMCFQPMGGMLHLLHFYMHHLAHSFLWTSIYDVYMYGALLAPFSILFRICGIFLLLYGWDPDVPIMRPSIRDVRFWFDTSFKLDLSYLWSHFKRRRRKLSPRCASYHLRLRIQYRVVWTPVRSPVPRLCKPSTCCTSFCR